MRLAILHDFLDKIGGGEKVAVTLARLFDGDLFSTNVRGDVLEGLGATTIRVRNLGTLPRTPPLKQIAASWLFSQARMPDYDAYLFSGNWAHYASGFHRPGILYCHTPVRAFYDQREAMLGGMPRWQRPIFRAWTRVHSRLDRKSISRIARLVANSENVRRRVLQFYGREATVVHPPVAVNRFRFRELGDFWLSVNRLYPEKRIQLQFDIFRRLPEERLVIVGGWVAGDHSARYAKTLKPPPNVEMLGEVSGELLTDLYARCKGLVAAAVDEDFGLTPLEAMASGKAVLAVNEGGYRETVLDGITGWLLAPDPMAFAEKIDALEEEELLGMRSACEARARLFDEERFMAQMARILEAVAGSAEGPQVNGSETLQV